MADQATDSPPLDAAGQSKKRETLTSRAKRIIGRGLETPKENRDNSSSPDDKNALKKGPPRRSPSRRRDQVLKAQRKHRERTQNYIFMLEQEVMQLRERETQFHQQVAVLTSKVKALEQNLLSHSIAVPQGLGDIPKPLGIHYGIDLRKRGPAVTQLASVDEGGHSSQPGPAAGPAETESAPGAHCLPEAGNIAISQQRTAQVPPGSYTQTVVGPSTVGLQGIPGAIAPDTLVADFRRFHGQDLHHICDYDTHEDVEATPMFDSSSLTQSLTSNDPSQKTLTPLGSQDSLDFVLELERICFPHITYQQLNRPLRPAQIPQSNFGINHVYSVTTHLVNWNLPREPTVAPIQYAKIDVENLFRSHLLADFGDDVSPLQVWENLYRIQGEGIAIAVSFAQAFVQELQPYVRCNGYGAVVAKDTINQFFHAYFSSFYKDTWTAPEALPFGPEEGLPTAHQMRAQIAADAAAAAQAVTTAA